MQVKNTLTLTRLGELKISFRKMIVCNFQVNSDAIHNKPQRSSILDGSKAVKHRQSKQVSKRPEVAW